MPNRPVLGERRLRVHQLRRGALPRVHGPIQLRRVQHGPVQQRYRRHVVLRVREGHLRALNGVVELQHLPCRLLLRHDRPLRRDRKLRHGRIQLFGGIVVLELLVWEVSAVMYWYLGSVVHMAVLNGIRTKS